MSNITAKKVGEVMYNPIIGEEMPECEMIALNNFSGGYNIDTKIKLDGAGIKLVSEKGDGSYQYLVTKDAYDDLITKYVVLLDFYSY